MIWIIPAGISPTGIGVTEEIEDGKYLRYVPRTDCCESFLVNKLGYENYCCGNCGAEIDNTWETKEQGWSTSVRKDLDSKVGTSTFRVWIGAWTGWDFRTIEVDQGP